MSPSDAVDYIKSKIRDFYATQGILERQWDAAAELGAFELIQKIESTLYYWDQTERGVKPFGEFFGIRPTGLGVLPGILPLTLMVTALAVAGGITLVLTRTATHMQELDLIAKGKLTPTEATAMKEKIQGGITGSISSLTKLATVAIVGYLAFAFIKFKR